MLYTKLQLRRPKTIVEMFSVARKVALTEDSTLESQDGGEERDTLEQSKKDYSPSSHGGKKIIRGQKKNLLI